MDKLVLAKRFEGYSEIFADSNPMSVDLKAMATALKGMTQEKFASMVSAEYKEEKDEDKAEKDAMLGVQPYGQPGGAFQNRVPLTDRYQGAGGMKGKLSPDQLKAVARKHGIPEDKMISAYPDLAGAAEVAASETVAKSASTEDSWTKEAFDAVAQNLVRDVLGMTKTVNEDTGRHQTKVQMPDAKKAPELKGVRPTEQDTGRALTPEQVPDESKNLESDMYKKSKGPVRKEAAEDADEETAEKAKEVGGDKEKEEKEKDIGQGEEKDAAKVDTEKEVADLKKKSEKADKAKKMEELKEKSRGKKEEAEASESVEASIEGISFEVGPDVLPDFKADMNDPEIMKLSSLFDTTR